MTVDIRAKVFCNLGPLISGNLSDELLTIGQGLIRCRGQLVLKGLVAPAIGSIVTFGYEKDGRVARLPRVLRVLGSFADPFRNTTTVSVGDKLVLLENKKSHVTPPPTPLPTEAEIGQEEIQSYPYPSAPQVTKQWNGACWQEIPPEEESGLSQQFPLSSGFNYDTISSSQKVTAAEQYGRVSVSDFAIVKPSLSAAFIALKCLGALGITAASLPLTNQYNEGEFDLSEGYVSVLEKLLTSESMVGYLNAAESLVVEPIDAVVGAGVIVGSDNVIDVSPLNFGTPPADDISVLISAKKNLEKKQPPDNVPPYANDFNLSAGPKIAGQPFIVSYGTLEANGYDPDYIEQIFFNTGTRLKVASVTAGSGCMLVQSSIKATITPDALPEGETKGVATFTYTLTDGQAVSNTATCFFEVSQPAEDELSPADIEQPLEAAKEEYQQVKDESQLPKKEPPDQETAAQQTESLRKSWELDKAVGDEKTFFINYTSPVNGEDAAKEYSYRPYSETSSTYDDLDRKVVSYSYQEGITAEVAGNILKAVLESGDDGGIGDAKVSWCTKEEFFYYTQFEKETEYTETLSEYGRAYEDSKERQKLAWQDAMEENRIANEGETGALKAANSQTCPLDFNPPANPEQGDTFNYDGMVFAYNSTTGWEHQKVAFAPVASSFPAVIYTRDLTDVTRTARESVISYMTEQVSRTYGPLREIFGGLPLPFDEEFQYMPSNTNVLTDKTIIRYDIDWFAGKAKTHTERWTVAANTASGQQYIKKLCDEMAVAAPEDRSQWITTVLVAATELVYLGVDTQIRTDRQYGVQQRPSIYDREWSEVVGDEKPDPEVFGDFSVVDRNATPPNKVVEIEQKSAASDPSSLTERSTALTVAPPYSTGPERILSLNSILQKFQALYEESKAEQQALTYGRAVNAIARGNRYGMNLQLGIESVPPSPLAWLYLQVGNVVAGYRTNGVSYVFNETGLLCSVDALFWGGVGGDGTPWFPLAQGITAMPPLPSITTQTAVLPNSITTPEGFDASAPGDVWAELPYTEEPVYAATIEPTALLAAVNEAIRCVALVRLSIAVQSFSYPLEVLSEVEALVVAPGVSAVFVKLLPSAVGVLTLSGQAAALVRRYRMVGSAGNFALNGFSASSNLDSISGPGEYTLVGQPAVLTYTELYEPAAKVLFYSGDGSSTRTVTGVGFEPGFVAIKGRNFAMPHAWHDLARGKNSAGYLWIRAGFAAAEEVPDTSSTGSTRGLQDFASDGWSMNGSSIVNLSGANYMAFCLKKGGAVASNTNGSITTQVTAQTSLEYSAFTYTGVGSISQTIGHGLSGAPDLVFIKQRTGTTNSAWVGGAVIGDNAHLNFTTTGLRVSSSSYYQGFSSTLISLGASLSQNNVTYAGWAFKAQPGKSAIGTFTGSGVVGATTTVALGYTPQFLMIKNVTSTTGDWFVYYMPTGGTGYAKQLRFNTEAAEGTSSTVQFTADGFSVYTSSSTAEALYWAFR